VEPFRCGVEPFRPGALRFRCAPCRFRRGAHSVRQPSASFSSGDGRSRHPFSAGACFLFSGK
jgi:hypothetical protein